MGKYYESSNYHSGYSHKHSNCQNHDHSSGDRVKDILFSLTPGTPLSSVVINGVSTAVASFVTVNGKTAYFVSAAGNLLAVDVKDVSSIEFSS
ncbi:hypothetical protein IEO70_15090 [Bacillus sp. AGMB 02131]|uniref:Uncharacterized protein n=1 Tax=Peribacillus faecalis TaxID=2772559 RepID=A0A927HCJ0_9BACI|nr:hypothetical protein [Peribacillus faecalis]MBD3109672.1 hypothetical protein [Peribacillus faecalis]